MENNFKDILVSKGFKIQDIENGAVVEYKVNPIEDEDARDTVKKMFNITEEKLEEIENRTIKMEVEEGILVVLTDAVLYVRDTEESIQVVKDFSRDDLMFIGGEDGATKNHEDFKEEISSYLTEKVFGNVFSDFAGFLSMLGNDDDCDCEDCRKIH